MNKLLTKARDGRTNALARLTERPVGDLHCATSEMHTGTTKTSYRDGPIPFISSRAQVQAPSPAWVH